jgi:hypothetical protein
LRLSRAIGGAANLPDIETIVVPRLRAAGLKEQADEVIAARAFGAMLDRARDATAALTKVVEPGRGGVPVAVLERDASVRRALGVLSVASKSFRKKAGIAGVTEPTALAFANAILQAKDGATAIRFLVSRVDQILGLSDRSVIRGALFRVIDGSESLADLEEGASSIEPDNTGRTFRIANLHSLLRDARANGAT